MSFSNFYQIGKYVIKHYKHTIKTLILIKQKVHNNKPNIRKPITNNKFFIRGQYREYRKKAYTENKKPNAEKANCRITKKFYTKKIVIKETKNLNILPSYLLSLFNVNLMEINFKLKQKLIEQI